MPVMWSQHRNWNTRRAAVLSTDRSCRWR